MNLYSVWSILHVKSRAMLISYDSFTTELNLKSLFEKICEEFFRFACNQCQMRIILFEMFCMFICVIRFV